MTRSGLLVLFTTLSTGLVACGSSESSSNSGPLEDLVPGDNAVSGWTIDKDSNMGGTTDPMTATTMEGGGKLIDGGIDPFYQDGFAPLKFLWQNYANSTLPDAPVSEDPKGATIMLYAFEMSSTDQASGMYTNLLKYSEYTRKKTETSDGWEDPSDPKVGDKSRIQDSGSDWFINFCKGKYYVEVKMTPSNGPAPDYTPGNANLKKEALRFAEEVAKGL